VRSRRCLPERNVLRRRVLRARDPAAAHPDASNLCPGSAGGGAGGPGGGTGGLGYAGGGTARSGGAVSSGLSGGGTAGSTSGGASFGGSPSGGEASGGSPSGGEASRWFPERRNCRDRRRRRWSRRWGKCWHERSRRRRHGRQHERRRWWHRRNLSPCPPPTSLPEPCRENSYQVIFAVEGGPGPTRGRRFRLRLACRWTSLGGCRGSRSRAEISPFRSRTTRGQCAKRATSWRCGTGAGSATFPARPG